MFEICRFFWNKIKDEYQFWKEFQENTKSQFSTWLQSKFVKNENFHGMFIYITKNKAVMQKPCHITL